MRLRLVLEGQLERFVALCILGVFQVVFGPTATAQVVPSVDSGGVRIFTIDVQQEDRDSILRLTNTPVVYVGSTPECEFFQVTAISLQSNGNIVVANSGDSEFCSFDGEGTYLGKHGREGAGPGEHRDLTFVQSFPGRDTLVVYDMMFRRFSLLEPPSLPI